MDKALLGWLLLLGIGFPLMGLLIHEAAERLEQSQPLLAAALIKTLRYVLPSLAIFLVMGQLLNVDSTHHLSRLAETLAVTALIVAGIALINAIFTTGDTSESLRLKVPNLFFQVVRAAVVLGLGYRILGGVWNIDLSGLAAAAGVGSLVIALALQDTLSNLVSGFLVLLSRPFKVGDYIEFDGVQGFVVDQNWRSVTLKDIGLEKSITVPNGTLAQATIDNFGNYQQDGKWQHINCNFSYDDPPFKVLALLSDLGAGLDDKLTCESVYPVIDSYGESSIQYKVWYKKSPGHSKRHPDSRQASVSTILYSRLYYLAKREGLTIPYPISVSYDIESPAGPPERLPQVRVNRQAEIAHFVTELPEFSTLNQTEIDRLSGVAQLKHYGLGEIIAREGQPDDGLYLIYTGSIWSSTLDRQGQSRDVAQLGKGELFGEMALFPGEVSPITVVARQDTEVIVLPAESVRQLIQGDATATGNSQFAAQILLFIDKRKQTLKSIKWSHEGPIEEANKDLTDKDLTGSPEQIDPRNANRETTPFLAQR